jgi:hypothetical protein
VRESSLVLPRLSSHFQPHPLYPDGHSSAVLDVSFENMSLAEIKVRLHSIRNSKLGRKLLIH